MSAILTVTRQTPTTVQYNISTRPAATSLATRLQRSATALTRGLIIVSVFLVLSSKTLVSPQIPPQRLVEAVQTTKWIYLVPAAVGVLWLALRRTYTTESLLVMRGLGVQISSSSASFVTGGPTRFIPTSAIQDVFVHEAFTGFEVRFYLAIVVEGEEDVVVVFPAILPPRHLLEVVWRGTRACLYETKT